MDQYLKTYTVAELRELLREYHIPGMWKKNKKELCEALISINHPEQHYTIAPSMIQPIADLPSEIYPAILLTLPIKDVLNFCITNKQFGNICEDEHFWFDKFKYDYPDVNANFNNPEKATWKLTYQWHVRLPRVTRLYKRTEEGVLYFKLDRVTLPIIKRYIELTYDDLMLIESENTSEPYIALFNSGGLADVILTFARNPSEFAEPGVAVTKSWYIEKEVFEQLLSDLIDQKVILYTKNNSSFAY